MKKVNLLLIAIISVVFLAVAIILIAIFGKNIFNNKPTGSSNNVSSNESILSKKTVELMEIKTKEEVESFIKDANYEIYQEEGMYYLYTVPVFDTLAEVEITMNADALKNLNIFIPLYEHMYDLPVSEDSDVDIEEEVLPYYSFTAEEKNEIELRFERIKTIFETYLKCGKIEQYDLIPARALPEGEVMPTDEDEKFYKGYVFKEFSVRDADGRLWLMQYEASDGTASVTIMKILDETTIGGFLPIIDMTKKN